MFSMWYKKQAEILFADIFNRIKKDFSIPADDSVIIKNRFMKSRWGTCIIKGSQKTINLNTHLLQLPVHLTEYVMAHELSHLVHMNHSPAFYDYLSKRIPDWQKLKKETDVWLFKIRDYR